jgi:hypothetical protein
MTGLIPWLGDSTLLPDFNANALQLLDGKGTPVRSVAPPNSKDLIYLGIPGGLGRPGLDAKGRLIYHSMLGSPMAAAVGQATGDARAMQLAAANDSAPIVRGDFDTRKVDTLAWMKTPPPGHMTTDVTPNPAGGPPTVTVHLTVNPFPRSDEWALLSDGSVAIVRVHDYHIDWVTPDGKLTASPKLPIDWRRYTDSEKTHRVDSMRKVMDEQVKGSMVKMSSMGGQQPQIKFDLNIVPDSEFPQFWPPVEPGSVLADLEDHLWVLPTTSTNAANGFTYDVINREGKIFERVQLPKGRVLAGFGPHDIVYMTHTDGKETYLERAIMNAPPK